MFQWKTYRTVILIHVNSKGSLLLLLYSNYSRCILFYVVVVVINLSCSAEKYVSIVKLNYNDNRQTTDNVCMLCWCFFNYLAKKASQ